ncbi:BadF/BadG/BcrA/BcrD ATPase family protein [Amorphoplanes nipponensis]|uniref:N-acetylglucosamine kinase n=1 Tax=Actinoplanes nipponensis TaxID=135950 RepID=A0A919MH50_9ACTN|nr:BadF/BadG/BcrA/BcrD ATPase family protein [Actinoplanes nipponensis]GIE49294.1 N-acetylglucosamine kinase [Actinoplanes nipponensis]
MKLVLGVDAGGTASRAVVATGAGAVVGRGSAGPGNPTVAGADAARAIGTAVRAALHGRDPTTVGAAVAGVAGVGVLAEPPVAAAFRDEWAAIGLTCPVTVVGDAVTAFAAGTAAPSGAVLIAGTGAVAARLEQRRISGTADGLGWLLGDEGSGLWLGLRAVRATARAWPAGAGSSDLDGLAAGVAAHAGARSCDELVHWAGRRPPAAFAGLAPLVCAAARAGDPLAGRLTAEAAARLLATLGDLGPPGGPVVLAGGLLTAGTPVRDAVLAALPGAAIARDPARGAAWLALAGLSGMEESAATRLHSVMLEGPEALTVR